MSNLISCNLMGGLGNQIFQAAHTGRRFVVVPYNTYTKMWNEIHTEDKEDTNE